MKTFRAEPRVAELEQRAEEMQSRIQERITSYEKEVKEVANRGSQGLDSRG